MYLPPPQGERKTPKCSKIEVFRIPGIFLTSSQCYYFLAFSWLRRCSSCPHTHFPFFVPKFFWPLVSQLWVPTHCPEIGETQTC